MEHIFSRLVIGVVVGGLSFFLLSFEGWLEIPVQICVGISIVVGVISAVFGWGAAKALYRIFDDFN